MIVFDLQAIQSAAHGERGIARYVRELALALAAEHPDVVDVFAWNDRLPASPRLADLELGGRLQPFSALRGRRVDVVHVNSPFELLPYGDIGVPAQADRLVTTCYDLIPYRFPERYLTDAAFAQGYRTRLGMLASADAVVTDSQSAADDCHDLLGIPTSRLTVLGAGVGERFVPPTSSIEDRMVHLRRTLPHLQAHFVFVPTGVDWRKNIPGAIAAFGRLPADVRDRHQLVLQCRVDEHQRGWIESLAVAEGILDQVVITGFVDDDDLVVMYQTAEVVLFPSFYEGFGLPVLEARHCGARVICSEGSSLPEVLPDIRARFDPSDVDAMSDMLLRSLVDASFAADLDRVEIPDMSWSRCAERLVEVYGRLRPRSRPHRDRPHLALATLLPPTPSGIADHSARLADALATDIDGVDVSVFVPEVASEMLGHPFPVHTLATLPGLAERGTFDAVLYCFGNNAWHRDFYRMMQIVPGSALLHDVRLVGVFDPFERDRLVGTVYTSDEEREAPLLARPIARAAVSVLVQSQHAAEMVERDSGVRAIDIGPLHCAQIEQPVERQAVPASDGDTAVPPWVVSVGIADRTKGTDVFVAAMRALRRRRDVRVALVGLGGEAFVEADDDIVVTGHVATEEYRRWMRDAAVMVQLRQTTNGESSGVVADALVHGTPLVVTDIGALGELPDEVAVRVPVDIGVEELAVVIETLLDDHDRRERMSVAGRAVAERETPAAQAQRVVDALFGPAAGHTG